MAGQVSSATSSRVNRNMRGPRDFSTVTSLQDRQEGRPRASGRNTRKKHTPEEVVEEIDANNNEEIDANNNSEEINVENVGRPTPLRESAKDGGRKLLRTSPDRVGLHL